MPALRKRLLVACLAVLSLLVVAWWPVSGHATAQVEISMVSPLVCDSKTVERPDPRADEPDTAPRIAIPRLDPDLACSLILSTTNHGRLPVRLQQIELPLMGPTGGAGVQVAQARTGKEHFGVGKDIDAVIKVDQTLKRDESVTVRVDYEFRPDGCTDDGTFGVPAGRAVVSSFGRSHTVEVSRSDWVYFSGTPASTC